MATASYVLKRMFPALLERQVLEHTDEPSEGEALLQRLAERFPSVPYFAHLELVNIADALSNEVFLPLLQANDIPELEEEFAIEIHTYQHLRLALVELLSTYLAEEDVQALTERMLNELYTLFLEKGTKRANENVAHTAVYSVKLFHTFFTGMITERLESIGSQSELTPEVEGLQTLLHYLAQFELCILTLGFHIERGDNDVASDVLIQLSRWAKECMIYAFQTAKQLGVVDSPPDDINLPPEGTEEDTDIADAAAPYISEALR